MRGRAAAASAPSHSSQRACPASVVSHVVRYAAESAAPVDLRVLAIRALGGTAAPTARDTLLGLSEGGRTFFGRRKLPPKSPELLATLRALAAGWAADSSVQHVLERAAASKDPEIRSAIVLQPERP